MLSQALGNQWLIGWVVYLLARLLFVSQQDPVKAQTLFFWLNMVKALTAVELNLRLTH